MSDRALPEAIERQTLERLVSALGEEELNNLSAEQLQRLVRSCAAAEEQQEHPSGAQPGVEEM